jgi:hypothetical protein
LPGDSSPRAAWLFTLSASPSLYPQACDSRAGQVFLIRMTEADYRAASFLDNRILNKGTEGLWAPFTAVEQAMAAQPQGRPLHFILHTGHVGSTLLSRLLDEVAPVLPLREPLPLRTLADLRDADPGTGEVPVGFARSLETFLKLWERGFPATQAIILKATSTAARLAPTLLAARPAAKAVYLNLAPELYLLTLLAGANAAQDLLGHKPGRIKRLEAFLGEAPQTSTLGELAAMSWLAERLSQARAVECAGTRVLCLDFEYLLGNVEQAMRQVLSHFGLTPRPEALAAIESSAVLKRYSKAPEYEYSPALRSAVLADARRNHAGELRKGLDWLDATAKRFHKAAGLLASVG